MRIGIDARFWSEQGHGRYVRNLINELQQIDNKNEYIIFLRKKDYDSVEFQANNFHKQQADIRWYTLKEQTVLLKIFLDAKLDLLHVPHFNIPVFYPKPFVVTIHDLTITHFPSIRATTLPMPIWKLKRFGYHIALRLALWRAKHVIAVSNFTKEEVVRYFPFTNKKISVTLEAVEQDFINRARAILVDDPVITKLKQRYGITNQYMLYIGNVHPHKNIDRLIKVFHTVHQELPTVELMLVGKDDFFQKRLVEETKSKGLQQGIVWTGFVPDDDLVPLLKGAAAFIFPSLMEGFGIPPLEAMACGTPTIVSRAASLPEVCGDASAYFDPADEDGMYRAIKEVLENAALRLTLVQRGYQQIEKFSWRKLAEQTLSQYIPL